MVIVSFRRRHGLENKKIDLEEVKLDREIIKETYKVDVVKSRPFEDDFKVYYNTTQNLKRTIKIEQNQLEIDKTKAEQERIRVEKERAIAEAAYLQEIRELEIGTMRYELTSKQFKDQYFMLLDRAKAKLIRTQSRIEYEKWKSFEKIIKVDSFINLPKATQFIIINALDNHKDNDNIHDYHDNVAKEINTKIKNENLKTEKMKNEQEKSKMNRDKSGRL
jgi:hypothetical protein